MTDFVLSAGNTIRPHRSPWGAFPVRSYKCSTGVSSNVIFVGSVVQLDRTAGSTSFQDCITKVTTSSNMLNPTAGSLIGVSAENWSTSSPGMANATSTSPGAQGSLMVWEANPMVEFKAWTRFGLLTSTIVGTVRDLTRDSTLNIDLVTLGASSLATPINAVIITGLIDASGDSGGAVTFRFSQLSSGLAMYR